MIIKNFYLNIPLKLYEYFQLKMEELSEDIKMQYSLKDEATTDGYVKLEVQKGMYGLPQTGLLA